MRRAVTTFESADSTGKRIVNQRHFDRLTASLAATKGNVAIGGGSDASKLSIQPTVVVDPGAFARFTGSDAYQAVAAELARMCVAVHPARVRRCITTKHDGRITLAGGRAYPAPADRAPDG